MGLPFGGTGPIRPDPIHLAKIASSQLEATSEVSSFVQLLRHDLRRSGFPTTTTQQAVLQDLMGEADTELILIDLFTLAAENNQSSERPFAHFIYSWLEARVKQLLPKSLWSYGKVAGQKRLALAGEGGLGAVLEPMAQDFIAETLDPTMIAGMALAFPLSRLTQFKVFHTLRGLPRATFWSHSRPAFLTAKTLGFAMEVSGFVFGAKTMAGLLGRDPDWSPGSLWAEMQGMALILFFIKGSGSLGRTAWKQVHGPAITPSQSYLFASHFTGIFASHHVMAQLNMGPPLTVEQNILASLKFLMQIEIGGKIGAALLSPLPIYLPPTAKPPHQVLDWHRPLSFAGVPEQALGTNVAMAGPQFGAGDSIFRVRRLADRLGERFKVGRQDPRVWTIAEAMDKTEFSHAPKEFAKRYRDLVLHTSFPDILLKDGVAWSALDLLQRGTEVFQHVMVQEPFRRGTGSFYDSLVQIALERTLESQKSPVFRNLLEVITFHRSTAALEKFMEDWSFHYRYQLRESVLTLALRSPQWRRRLKNLNMPHDVHRGMAAYLATFSQGGDAKPFRDPNYNYLILRGPYDTTRQVPMQAEYALKFLEQRFENPENQQAYGQVLTWVMEQAGQSKVPLLYFDRLFKILATGGLHEKVVEIASPDTFHWASLYRWVSVDPSSHYPEAAAKIDGSLYTGYVKDYSLAQKFARFYHSVPLLTHPDRAKLHRNEFHLFADRALGEKTNFGPDEVIELLYHRPTPLARQAREALVQKVVDFDVLSETQMLELAKRYQPNLDGEIPEGIFLPPHRSPSGRPFIGILEIDPNFSREKKISDALNLAAITVHEFEHFLHHRNLGPFTQSAQMRSEMRAWLEEYFYLLQQGETLEWNRSLNRSPEGFGVYLRKLIDLSYLKGPKDLVIR